MPDAFPMLVSDNTVILANPQLEQSFLGALLLRPDLAEHVPISFHASHLADPWHVEIYESILAIGSSGRGSFAVVQAIALGDKEKAAYIAGLMSAVIDMGKLSIKSNCAVITDLWRRREIVKIADDLRERAHNSNGALSSGGYATEAMTRLDMLSSTSHTARAPVSLIEAVDEAIAAGERMARGEIVAMSTGLPSIDAALGGLEPGCLYILAARPGMGKTALGLQIGVSAALNNVGTLVVSLEMQAAQLGRRALAWMSGVPAFALRAGKWSQADVQRIAEARKRASEAPLTIVDESGQNTAMIALKARTAQRKHGLGLLIVDHLHIVAQDAAATRMGETWAVGKISNDLKRLAKDLNIPVIALAQLNRGVESREDKRPSMADLRQSGNIEQDADAIMFLYRAEYYLGKSEPERGQGMSSDQHYKKVQDWKDAKERVAGQAEVIFSKVREGEPRSITLRFDGARTCFTETDQWIA